jgi:murein DD-endopeptidase MepM/ murein hydrolase activator NlpD
MMFRLLLLVLVTFSFSNCSLYDYHPRGVHQTSKTPSKNHSSSTYVVKKGDTLYGIGKKLGVDYKELAQINGIRRPYTLYVGQRLKVGYKNRAKAVTKQPSKAKKPKKAGYTPYRHPVASHGNTKLIWPAEGRLSSKFGMRKTRMHDGIDIANVQGTRIVAAASGTVVHANAKLSGYGNLIIIRHASDMFTAYAHNQKNLVKQGDKVTKGQLIAYMGSTGRSTGPHVHFEVRRGETAVDPLAYLPKR